MNQEIERMDRETLHRELLAERDSILKHKWCMSEQAGHDVGFEAAFWDWLKNHRENLRKKRDEERAWESADFVPRNSGNCTEDSCPLKRS